MILWGRTSDDYCPGWTWALLVTLFTVGVCLVRWTR